MRRFTIAGALIAAVALAAAAGASAAVSPSYQVGGVAFGAPQSTTTSFFGTGVGSTGDRVTWNAAVNRGPAGACAAVGGSCPVAGGSLAVRSNNGSNASWTFSGGSLALTSAAPGCGRQTFALTGNLTSSAGDATLTATVTTFRFQFRGQCLTLFSAVSGQLAAAAAAAPPPPGDGSGDL